MQPEADVANHALVYAQKWPLVVVVTPESQSTLGRLPTQTIEAVLEADPMFAHREGAYNNFVRHPTAFIAASALFVSL
jgi:hypothetical protein